MSCNSVQYVGAVLEIAYRKMEYKAGSTRGASLGTRRSSWCLP